jgi:sporulation protein YlmC with PRC-barrel domain
MKIQLKKKVLIAALVPVFGVPLAFANGHSTSAQAPGPQAGQTTQQPQTGAQQQRNQQAVQVRDMRASEIIGATVRDQNNENLGDVQDLIVDVNGGQVDYAILAFGGFLGFGEKLFAYPMDRFQPTADGQELVLSVSEQELKNAPGFDRSNWPTFGMGGYRGEVDQHFGQTAQAGGNLVRMSDLLNEDIQDRAGNDVGQIEDVVVSVTDGKVRYVVMEPDNDLNMGNQFVILPMNAIEVTGERQAEAAQTGQRQTGAGTMASGQADPQTRSQAGQAPGQQARTDQPGRADMTGQRQARTGLPGQQAQTAETGQPGQPGQRAGVARTGGADQDLALVLSVAPEELRNARTFERNQWPDLNSAQFQQDIDSYVAGFPTGGQQATGATGDVGQPGAGAAGAPATQQERTPQDPAQRQPGAAGTPDTQTGQPGTGAAQDAQTGQPGATGQPR